MISNMGLAACSMLMLLGDETSGEPPVWMLLADCTADACLNLELPGLCVICWSPMLNEPICEMLREGEIVVDVGDLGIGGGGSFSDNEGADSESDAAGLSIRDALNGSKASSTASSFVAWTLELAFLGPAPLDIEDDGEEEDGN